jgi:hypothetical protein
MDPDANGRGWPDGRFEPQPRVAFKPVPGTMPLTQARVQRDAQREAERRAELEAERAGRPEPRRRALMVAVAGVAALAVAGGVTAVAVGWRDPEPQPAPAAVHVTRTAPPPSPTIAAAPREPGTAFFEAIPTTVGAYVFQGSRELEAWLDAGAIEAYQLTYSDGARQVTLRAGQWETPEEAREGGEALTADPSAGTPSAGNPTAETPSAGTPAAGAPSEGDPNAETPSAGAPAAGAPSEGDPNAGDWSASSAADPGIVWLNETARFEATGPAAAIEDFQARFPM